MRVMIAAHCGFRFVVFGLFVYLKLARGFSQVIFPVRYRWKSSYYIVFNHLSEAEYGT